LGKVRRAIDRLPCSLCGAKGYDPCLSRTTGKAMKGNHGPRARAGRHDAINEAMRKLDGMDEQFWQWAWIYMGLRQGDYPGEVTLASWNELYAAHPEIDPTDQYHGSW
jgi:hypothetical protein